MVAVAGEGQINNIIFFLLYWCRYLVVDGHQAEKTMPHSALASAGLLDAFQVSEGICFVCVCVLHRS